MNLNAKVGVALVSILLLLSVSARAMSLEDFGRMNNDDEATYVAMLVEASAHMLKANGQPEQAEKTISFFRETGPSGGTQQLAAQMKSYYAMNKEHQINPNNRVPAFQVEDALATTLKQQGINVPVKFLLTAGNGFSPIGPPRRHLGDP